MVVLAGGLSGCGISALHEVTQTVKHEHVPGSRLHVESANGSISVKQNDRSDVQIVAHLRAVSAERLNAAKVVAERADDEILSIRVDWPQNKRHNREGCSLEILIPDAAGVHLRTSNGRLCASGLGGKADLQTSNGAIEIENHSGPVVTRTSNGSIALTKVSGTIDAQSSNAKIAVVGATRSVKARTSNGSIWIALAPESPGPIDARTSNASVDIELGPSFSGDLSLTTSNGSVKVDDVASARVVSSSKNQAQLAFGDADHKSTVRTNNGSIRIQSLRTSRIQEKIEIENTGIENTDLLGEKGLPKTAAGP